MPDLVGKLALSFIDSQVRKRAGFEIKKLDMQAVVGQLTTPTLFVGSDKDTLTPF